MPPKKMPQKKKGEEDEPPGYNIKVMTLDQLKQYVRLLEGEIEDMRRHCNFYQKTEDELIELIRITEEDMTNDEEILIFKDVELEKLKLNFLKHLREKRQVPKYMEHSSSEKREKLSSEISARLEEEQNRHISETKKLKSILLEKNRELEALKIKIQMDRREAKEKNEEHLRHMDSSHKNALIQTTERYENAMRDAQDEFKQALESIKLEAREEKIRGEKNLNEACMTFKQNLQNYYKETTKQDLDTIKTLKNKIVKILETIKKSKVLLVKAKQENKDLKQNSELKLPKHNQGIVAKFDAGPLRLMEALKIHNKTEQLALENHNLEKQIKDVTKRTENLRRQFTTALGKVRDCAETKVAFLDRKLNFILEEKENKTIVDTSDSNVVERLDEDETGTETSNSDTSDNP